MLRAAACASALLLSSAHGYAADPGVSTKPGNCDSVGTAVRAEIQKDPQKVLLVVEDFMVTNETCACEIVKAAILSTKGPSDLKKQIAVTATHVAPQMGAAIADCVAAIVPDEAQEITSATQKEAGTAPAETVAQAIPAESTVSPTPEESTVADSTSDDYKLPLDLRGVFFIEPMSIGVTGSTTSQTTTSSEKSSSGEKSSSSKTITTSTTTTYVAQNTTSRTPNRPSALSPSSASSTP